MAVIYSSDLSQANSSAMLTALDKVNETADKLINKINNFMSTSNGHLSGDVFTVVNSKLSLYVDALTKQKQICINLKSNAKAANNTMLNYMEGYDKLDDGEKDAIKGLITQINTSIQYLESQDKTLNTSLQADINRLYGMLAKLDKDYQKLEGLAAADMAAFNQIVTVNGDIANYTTAIRSVSIGWKNAFYNLGHRDVMYYDQRGYYNENGEFVEWQSNWRSGGGNPIRDAGCGPTSYAAVIATMLHDPSITPATIADIMYEHGWKNGGYFISNVSEVYGVNCTTGRWDADTLEAVINAGGGYIGSANNGGHYISVTDVVYIDGQRYFVLCDSWPGFNGGKTEPTLVTEQELRARDISCNWYITPSDTVVVKDEYERVHGVERV